MGVLSVLRHVAPGRDEGPDSPRITLNRELWLIDGDGG
jgi:hypothetical protein